MPTRTHRVSANVRFMQLREYIRKVQDELTGIMDPDVDSLGIYAARDAELRRAFGACERATGRRRSYTWEKAMEHPECVDINRRHMDSGNEIIGRYRNEVRACREAQVLLAPECDLSMEASERANVFHAYDAGMYWSQGYGACKYARERAEQDGDRARAYGIEYVIEVRNEYSVKQPAGGSVRSAEYAVLVPLTRVGCDILDALPAIELRERVRRCWKRGVNPRVYMPFLPVGYEESVGLNFFGGDSTVEKRVETGCATPKTASKKIHRNVGNS